MFLFKNTLLSQLNLIQNSSFESHTNLQCSGAATTIDSWSTFYSPDYYNTLCTTGYFNVPHARFGDSYAKDGIAYIGIISYVKTMEQKEYIYQQLISPLIADSIYCLSFYVSRADYIPYAIKNIGAYFSNNVPNHVYFITATPQVVYNSGFITDTINWTEVQGCFTAQGGEQYITIGNFNSNANTDTLFVGTTNQVFGGDGYAYYYIDSVTLYQNNFPTAINEFDKENGISVYPNPANGLVTITSKYDFEKIELLSITGQVLLQETVNSKTHALQLQNLAEGIYFLKVVYANGMSVTKKVVKQ